MDYSMIEYDTTILWPWSILHTNHIARREGHSDDFVDNVYRLMASPFRKNSCQKVLVYLYRTSIATRGSARGSPTPWQQPSRNRDYSVMTTLCVRPGKVDQLPSHATVV